MLRVFSTLFLLTGKEEWNQRYLEIRNGYSNLATKAPHGIGHALTAIAEADAFDAIQLHGDEPPSRALQAGRLTGTAVIKVLTGGSAAAEAYASVDGFLFDAPVKPGERRGGHGAD